MARYKPNCQTCQLAKKDAKARIRIRNATFNRTVGDETLQDISREYGLSNGGIYNHSRKHIVDDTEALQRRQETITAKKVALIKADVQKDLELQLDADTVDDIDSDPLQILGLKEYIAQGNKEIKEGKLKITAQSYLVAVRTLNEYESKKTNNKIEFLRTISSFRSGNPKKPVKPPEEIEEGEIVDGTASPLTESIDRGEEQAGSVHRRAFGNAFAPRTNSLSRQNQKTE